MDPNARQIEVIVEEALHGARSWRPTPREAKRVKSARGALRRLTSSSPKDALFDSIKGLLPFAAGMLDVLPGSRPTDPANLVHNVPEAFLDARAQRISDDPSIPLAIRLPAGLALRGPDAMPNGAFYRDPYCQMIYCQRHGLDNVTGMILSPKGESPMHQVVVLWLFSGTGERLPTWEECRLLDHVCGDLREAVDRARLPFIPHQRLQFQIWQEQGVGYVLLREDGALLEVNRRAVLLSQTYDRSGTGSWRDRLDGLMTSIWAARRAGSHAKQWLQRPDGSGALELNLHWLAKEEYAVGQHAWLIEMREAGCSGPGGGGELLDRLPPRQRQIATLFIESGLSYKQIADKLTLSVGTVRVHVERMYKTLRVHSRAELVELQRRTPWGFTR